MLKEKDMIKVHLYDASNREIKTRNYNKVFEVFDKNGKLGIDWNTERSPYICRGEIFTPFEVFAPSVTFENIETNESYYFSNIKNELEKISQPKRSALERPGKMATFPLTMASQKRKVNKVRI